MSERTGTDQQPTTRRQSSSLQIIVFVATVALGVLTSSPALADEAPTLPSTPETTDSQAVTQKSNTANKQVDAAIENALKFLAEQQGPNGSWKADAYGESTGATSLAVLAFLAAGHVPGEGEYGGRLEQAVTWVLDQQQPGGMIVAARSHGPLYCHGISTLMLAEVAGMLDKPLAERCRAAIERSVRLLLEAQSVAKEDRHAGGWRYQTTSQDSDLSVTAWQLLALRAAKNIGCDVPAESIERAVEYVRKCHAAESGGFAYQPGATPSATRTGTGVVALEICGQHLSDEVLHAAEYLREKPLHPREQYFYYGAYYCSVAMFLMGGEERNSARRELANLLLERQLPDGSWQAETGSEQAAGKVYATAMTVLALAVDHHYLPIYQR